MSLKSIRDFAVIYKWLSDSALWKILRVIKPSQRHAMAGLDSLTADGLKGFLILSDTVKKICDNSKARKLLQQHLEDGKRYLKIGYRMHCKDISPIDTHCIRFALLHSQDEKPHHDHEHQDGVNSVYLFSSLSKLWKNLLLQLMTSN